MTTRLAGHVVVLSPHIDDAVFSLGASLACAARAGARVKVVTVFGNDPASARDPSPWDATCGFGSEGDAARARREEDRQACAAIGASPVWLNFNDEEYLSADDDDEIWGEVATWLTTADRVLCPGFPLAHADHLRVTRLAVARLDRTKLGFYVEQPYANWRLIGRGRREWAAPGLTTRRALANTARIVLGTRRGRQLQQPSLPKELAATIGGQPSWTHTGGGVRDWWAKQRAVQAYASQLRFFGPLIGTRIALYELGWRGEGLALVDPAPAA